MPESMASSTRYCTTGLSTIGISSLGRFLVAGRKRVPKPATAITAFLIFNVIPSNVIFSNAVRPGRRLPSVLKIVPDVPTRLGSRSASRTCARNCPPLPHFGGEGGKGAPPPRGRGEKEGSQPRGCTRRAGRVDPYAAGGYPPEGLQARRGMRPTSILHGRTHVVKLPRLLFRLLLGRRLPTT